MSTPLRPGARRAYGPAEALRRKYVTDPVADLLSETQALLAAADNDADRRQVIEAADAAAGTLMTPEAQIEFKVAKLDPLLAGPVTYQVAVDGRMMTVDDLAATDPQVALVVAAFRAAATPAEAYEIITAAQRSVAAQNWSPETVALVEGLRYAEIVDDGFLQSDLEEAHAELRADLAAADALFEAQQAAARAAEQRRGEAAAAVAAAFGEAVGEGTDQ